MIHQTIDAECVPHPASKWTAEVQARFLEHLSRKGNVRAACLSVGASTETAYRLRRRDPAFARGWAAAMVHARRAAEQVLADRAIEGVIEDMYYRGEWVGSRRKYDSRLLLAHLARLDRQANDPAAEADADRFDEILAVILDGPTYDDVGSEDELLAVGRERFADHAAQVARLERLCPDADEQDAGSAEVHDEEFLDPEELWAREEALEFESAEAAEIARAEARQEWDTWYAGICEAVDAVLAVPSAAAGGPGAAGDLPAPADRPQAAEAAPGGDADISLRTVSTVSTPAAAGADAQTKEAAPEDGLSQEPEDGPPGGGARQ